MPGHAHFHYMLPVVPLLALSVIGLTAHELAEERAVRSLTLKAGRADAEQQLPPTRMAA